MTEPRPPSVWRTWRQRLGWTQAHAATKTGLRVATISLIETGKAVPSLETASLLATAYGVTPEEAGAVLVRRA